MNTLRSLLLGSILTPLAASQLLAGTWIVDDDGGPGVDFTDIQPAIDAAAPGDVILVLGGSYSAFTLDTAATIVGQPGAVVQGGILVQGVVDGPFAVVAELTARDVDVDACASTVVLDALQLTGPNTTAPISTTVNGCADVRLRDVRRDASSAAADYELRCTASRVEYVDGLLLGEDGVDCPSTPFGCSLGGNCQGTPGAPGGQQSSAPTTLHVYRTSATGGDMGFDCQGFPFPAGPGLRAVGGELLVAGQPGAHVIGSGSPFSGDAIQLSSLAAGRVSGVTLGPGGVSTSGGATVELPPLPDPTLHVLAPGAPGQVVTFRVNAPVGSAVALNLGRFPDLIPVGGLEEDILVKTVRTFQLGTVGGTGVVGLNFTVPAYLGNGFTFFAQARVTLPGGGTRYSNSVPVVLR